jgi:four helix bundle protein
MPSIQRFEEIEAWKTARELTNLVYDLSESGSFAHDFGLRGQIQRASVSVMSNIAEGFESQTQSLFLNFLGRAKGSAGEVRSQLYVALDRNYISQDQFHRAYQLIDKCSRQIYGFMKYLESQPNIRRVREEEIDYETQP